MNCYCRYENYYYYYKYSYWFVIENSTFIWYEYCIILIEFCAHSHIFSAIRLNLSRRKLATKHHVVVALSSLLFPRNLFRDYVARLPYDHGFTSLSFLCSAIYLHSAGRYKKIFPPLKGETRCREMRLEFLGGKKFATGTLPRLIRANLFCPI